MQAAIRSAILALCFTTALSHAADLTVRIDKVESADGQVMVALYDSSASFLKQPVRGEAAPAGKGSTTIVFKDLAPGEYAFAAFHDANGNGRMDANPMGIPVEPIAFSKDAQGHMGPPAFEAAKFTVPATGALVTATLR